MQDVISKVQKRIVAIISKNTSEAEILLEK